MLVEIVTDIDSPSGYSKHAREFTRAIVEAGVKVKIVPSKHDKTTVILDDWWAERLSEFQNETGHPDIRMQIETPEFFQPQNGVINIGFTAWETSRIPGAISGRPARMDWVAQMNQMDEMWTPGKFAIDAFVKSGVTAPVMRHCPLPLNLSIPEGELGIVGVTADPAGRVISREKRKIVIGSVGQWTWRKNIDDLLIAVCSEFRSREVVLLLKTYGSVHNIENEEAHIRQKVNLLKRGVQNDDLIRVVLIQSSLTDQEMDMFYNSIDMYVTLSRGEGFCIPAAQAMANGVPVIATGWSAFTDYIFDKKSGVQTGWPVKHTMEPVYGMPHIPWYLSEQRWAKADMVHAMDTMREIWTKLQTEEGRAEIKEITDRGKAFMQATSSHKAVGEKAKKFFEEALG